ncbi:MAG: peptidoglycan-binding protein [Candidatus Paceibacterota bacterium]
MFIITASSFAFHVEAGPFFVPTSDALGLIGKFSSFSETARPVRILVVPGHDDVYRGAQFKDLLESDLNLNLALKITEKLSQIPGITATTSRTSLGYRGDLSQFMLATKDTVLSRVKKQKSLFGLLAEAGLIEPLADDLHAEAGTEVAERLYSTNEWINKEGYDIVLHVHFNDYASHKSGTKGKYTGISVYYPDVQYGNGLSSKFLAKPLYSHLRKLYAQSDFPKENVGLIEDQSLIALGSNNTLNAASVLVEYGYIYESQFSNPEIRNGVFEALSTETCKGFVEFFAPARKELFIRCGSVLSSLPKSSVKKGDLSADVFSVQRALTELGFIPARGYTQRSCTVNGKFGPCTELAVKTFQKKYKIPSTGVVGNLTIAKLRSLLVN